jgi:tRNA dimethylallyltransferase
MFTKGLIDEIKQVASKPLGLTAVKIIGIPEVMGHLKGEYDLERAKYLMKLHTRHYVKRQLTWFRRDKRIEWIDITAGQPVQQIAEIITGGL